MRIWGELVKGWGAAAGTVKKQLPKLVKYEPRLKDCHHGTINVRLDEPLFVRQWDTVTDPIRWHDEDTGNGERFGLLSVTFIHRSTNTPAWIYDPHGSPHRADPFLVEVLAPKLDVQHGDRCVLEFLQPARRASCTMVW